MFGFCLTFLKDVLTAQTARKHLPLSITVLMGNVDGIRVVVKEEYANSIIEVRRICSRFTGEKLAIKGLVNVISLVSNFNLFGV